MRLMPCRRKSEHADDDEGCQTGVGQEQARSKARAGQEQGRNRGEAELNEEEQGRKRARGTMRINGWSHSEKAKRAGLYKL